MKGTSSLLFLGILWGGLAAGLLMGCRSAEPPAPEPSLEADEGIPGAGAPESEAVTPSEALERAMQTSELRAQKATDLAEKFVALGKRNYEEGNLEEAYRNFGEALDLDSTNEEAREYFDRVSAMLNLRPGTVAEALNDSVDRKVVRIQQARLEADKAFKLGVNAYDNAVYDEAIRHFEDALAILNWFPYDIDTSFDRGIVQDYLRRSQDLLDTQRKAEEAAVALEVEREKRAEAQNARLLVRERVANLLRDADTQFERGNYEVAAKLAEQVLELDYENEKAGELRDLALHAHHVKKDQEILREYSEEWRRTIEDVKTSMVVQNSVVEFPKGWEENQGRRKPIEFREEAPEMTEEEARIRNLLKSIKFSPAFEDEPLADVIDFFHAISGANFVIARQVTDELSESELTVSLTVSDIAMDKALNLITGLKGLVWKVDNGVVKITTLADVGGEVYLELYNVRDLTTPIVDYPGEEMYLKGSAGFETFDEGFEAEEPSPAIAADRLVQLIQENIGADSWNPPASIDSKEGTLVVMQTREIHKMIRDLLDDLRRSQGILVHVQARFLTAEDNFLEDIGVDFRGLGDNGGGGVAGKGTSSPLDDVWAGSTSDPYGAGTGNDSGVFYDDGGDGDIRGRVENLLDESLGEEGVLTGSGGFTGQFTYLDDTEVEAILRAVRKSERVNQINAPSLLIANNGRASMSLINQVSYIKDFDVEIAQASAIADPIVDIISDGVIMDVRPVVSSDRRFITLELRPTVSQLERPIQFRDVSFSFGNAGRLQLPKVEVQRVRTTVTVPDGGTLLLGGLKIAEERDVKSGVPILSDIPIVSFFFSRRGEYKRYKNLLILLRAHVVIMSEHEPGQGVRR